MGSERAKRATAKGANKYVEKVGARRHRLECYSCNELRMRFRRFWRWVLECGGEGLPLPLAVEEEDEHGSGHEKGGSEERSEDFCRDVAWSLSAP